MEDQAHELRNRATRLFALACIARNARLTGAETLTRLAEEALTQAEEIEGRWRSSGDLGLT